ncbi:MAG: glycosyltransferase [Verrucomicrobiota bacterium]
MTLEGASPLQKLLIYCPYSHGGLADYAHLQANALVEQGVSVTLLVGDHYPERSDRHYQLMRELKDPESLTFGKSIWRSVCYFCRFVICFFILQKIIRREKFNRVLFTSYVEYFSPFWAPALNRLKKEGVVFGAMVHEPVRDFIVGPLWWHRYCIHQGYSFLREAFEHEEVPLDTGGKKISSRVTVIPQGTFEFPQARRRPSEVRDALQIPQEAKLILAFGHIRDNKNLDLLIRSIQKFPNIYLLIAGATQSLRQKNEEFYRQLAVECAVTDRCRWDIRHIPPEIAADYFEACDLVATPYGASFLSASGVLSAAVGFRKPSLVSAGDGCLKQTMKHYRVGYWVEPDHPKALEQGIQNWLEKSLPMEWEEYLKDHSWEMNAKRVIERMFEN